MLYQRVVIFRITHVSMLMDDVVADQVSAQERERILKLIRHIHSVTGHGSMTTMIQALQKRGVPNHVLEVARQFKCSLCEERKRVAPRRPATLEVAPAKWQVIQSDLGSWTNPVNKNKYKFILFIDEGCRFRTGKILFENSRSQAHWPLLRTML